jgi:hypothetical protein
MLHKGELEGTKDPVAGRRITPQRVVHGSLKDRQNRSQGWGFVVLPGNTRHIHDKRWQKLFIGTLSGVASTSSHFRSSLPVWAAGVVTVVERECRAALVPGLFTRWVTKP